MQYGVRRQGVPSATSFARWALAAMPGMPLTLRVVGGREGRRLNGAFRKKDRATNVLSFPLDGEGDIVLCHPVVVRRPARHRCSPLPYRRSQRCGSR